MATSTYVALGYQTLSSNQSTVTFSGISQAYTELILVGHVNPTGASGSICYRLGNGTVDSTTTYSATWGYGTGPITGGTKTHSSNGVANNNLGVLIGWQTALGVTGQFSYGEINIFNYSSTNSFKTILGNELATTDNLIENHVTTWRNNNPVDIITIFNNGGSGTLGAGSSFALYGVKSA